MQLVASGEDVTYKLRRCFRRCIHIARQITYQVQHPIHVQRPCIELEVNVSIATSELKSYYNRIYSLSHQRVPTSLGQRFAHCYNHNTIPSIVLRQTVLNVRWFTNVHQKPQFPQGKGATPPKKENQTPETSTVSSQP